jgi:hypothetical protein
MLPNWALASRVELTGERWNSIRSTARGAYPASLDLNVLDSDFTRIEVNFYLFKIYAFRNVRYVLGRTQFCSVAITVDVAADLPLIDWLGHGRCTARKKEIEFSDLFLQF